MSFYWIPRTEEIGDIQSFWSPWETKLPKQVTVGCVALTKGSARWCEMERLRERVYEGRYSHMRICCTCGHPAAGAVVGRDKQERLSWKTDVDELPHRFTCSNSWCSSLELWILVGIVYSGFYRSYTMVRTFQNVSCLHAKAVRGVWGR